MSGHESSGLGGIAAKVIADSLHPAAGRRRLITLQLRYPRFIHSEFMTHRVFSRNASSSRAIPVAKVLEQVRNEPAMPIHWGKNQPGMQASEEGSAGVNIGWADEFVTVQEAWKVAADNAAFIAERMSNAGYHKQVVNRLLEPFQFISVIVTATEWENFFQLRDHPDAQPEIRELAKVMKAAMNVSRPRELQYGDWHLPYVTAKELGTLGNELARKVSAARCARVSYLTHDGHAPSVEKDLELFDRLVGSVPLHASPIEHQATPLPMTMFSENIALCGNFVDWIQYRKVHENSLSKN